MAEKVPGWLERVLLPQISELKGEMKVVNTRIEALDQRLTARIDGLEGRMDGEFRAVHSEIERVEEKLSTKVDELDSRMSTKIDELGKRLDITQRLAVVEEQLKELRASRD